MTGAPRVAAPRSRIRARSRALTRPLCLLALSLLGGCVFAAVGATSTLVSQEFVKNANMAYLRKDQAVVWAATKRTLTHMSGDPIKVDEPAQAARGTVDGAVVTVLVEIFDVNQTKLSVGAKKWAMYDAEIANDVITAIKRELER